ncbi:unnamed protein product [Hydatigera taeniaeformis]|uniref:Uncharacterized protein n=1 Tax=Hydatigena taeniaeformis TaxID=6205 RepID=A0A0R3WM97_HYDTA|nr:unnamed protein product [Hydatigera taeniaeformis]
MRERTGSVGAVSVVCTRSSSSSGSSSSSSSSRRRWRRAPGLISGSSVLLVAIIVVGCAQVGIASATSGFSDILMGTSRSFPPSGDAPNSSVCRHALKQVPGHAAKCNISRDFRGCRFDSGFISYLEFQYCQFASPVLPTILMLQSISHCIGALDAHESEPGCILLSTAFPPPYLPLTHPLSSSSSSSSSSSNSLAVHL